MEDISGYFWKHIEDNKNKQLQGKIYNWLNKDNLSSIINDNGVFWFEYVTQNSSPANYIYDYMVKWGKKRGLKYLYEL